MFPSPNSSNLNLDSSSSPFFNFPSSPFTYDYSSIYLQPFNMENHTTSIDDVTKAKKQLPNPPRKRSSKKDRHSKIYTAKGPRDRRMRLSLDVARKFFDLQDMLGFDKASKTVEWLLTQSESSIEEVKKTLIGNEAMMMFNCKVGTRSSSSPSITSGCDAAFEIFDGSRKMNSFTASGSSSRPNVVDPSVVRESRKMARARAKERTMEKMWIQGLNSSHNNGSNPPQESVDESQLGQSLFSYLKPSMENVKRLGLGEELVVGDDHSHEVSLPPNTIAI